jgi:RNA polymerase sigma-70 factor, ECF subfamily
MAETLTEETLETHRRELTGYCYRMLGSAFEAEDAVQETMLRAWRAADTFEGRATVRSWLYRIATNICLDMLRGRQRRALPMDLGPASPPKESLLGGHLPDEMWVTPIPDASVLPEHGDPAEIAVARDSIRLAFVTALQHLPPKQRAALILCEVLRWPAADAAAMLESSVPSVNSALQRARATLAALPSESRPATVDDAQEELLARYVDAFQRYDMDALVKLMHEDAVMTMPPFGVWIRGAQDIVSFFVEPTPSLCADSVLVPVKANGVASAWGQYKPDPDGGRAPWTVQLHEVIDGKFSRLTYFHDRAALFPLFGLPPRID